MAYLPYNDPNKNFCAVSPGRFTNAISVRLTRQYAPA